MRKYLLDQVCLVLQLMSASTRYVLQRKVIVSSYLLHPEQLANLSVSLPNYTVVLSLEVLGHPKRYCGFLVKVMYIFVLIFPMANSTICQIELLKDKLGYDEAFNYKEEPDLVAALKRLVSLIHISERIILPTYVPTILCAIRVLTFIDGLHSSSLLSM